MDLKHTIFVARHGETPANRDKLFRGWTDYPLDRGGRDQASDIASALKSTSLTEAHSSDLSRSVETAKIVTTSHKKVSVQEHKQFRPWDVGLLTGKKKANHRDTISDRVAHPDKSLPDGESLNEFRDRFRPAFENLMAKAKLGGGPIFVAVHASNLHEIGTMIDGDADSIDISPGGYLAMWPKGHKWEFEILKGQQARATEYEGLS